MASPIFALHGADIDFEYYSPPSSFGMFGAAVQSVADLQNILLILGKNIGDPVLKALVVDGMIGPKTVAATNRALVTHIGAGQAPAAFRTGTLTQAQVLAEVGTITGILVKEAQRRGHTITTAKVIVPSKAIAKVTAPRQVALTPTGTVSPIAPGVVSPELPTTEVPAASSLTDLTKIMKWAALGVGVSLLGVVGYYFLKSRQVPTLAGPIPDMPRIWRANQQLKNIRAKIRTAKSAAERARLQILEKQMQAEVIRVSRPLQGWDGLPAAEQSQLEQLLDRAGSTKEFFESLHDIAYEKAEHVRSSWQDEKLAKTWEKLARRLERFARTAPDPYAG